MSIKDLFFEVIREAKDGIVKIDDEEFYVCFNTNIDDVINYSNDYNDACLNISDLDLFLNKLEEYINLEVLKKRKNIRYIRGYDNYIKSLITYLFVNATLEDFNNPIDYINRYIGYLKDDLLSKYDDGFKFSMNGVFNDDSIYVKNTSQSIMMETPNKLEISIINNDNNNFKFFLPEISYGICEENGKKVCYIYSILNREDLDNVTDLDLLKYKKNISRKLYKLNKGIKDLESDEFIQYKNNESDYYPENVSDVSVSAVLSLYVFINIIKNDINLIKGVPYLPIRYFSRDFYAENNLDSEKRIEKQKRNDEIQYNITEKFIRTFRRVALYIDDFDIDSYPYEFDEFINCSINKNKKEVLNNEVIDSVGIKK